MGRRLLTIPAIGRAAAFTLVAAAIVATAVHFRHDDARAHSAPAAVSHPGDPLAAELARCQSIGMAAQNDAACEVAWAENRRRFFTYRPADAAGPTALVQPVTPKSEDR
jgi:conjugative transfer region protein TrbK